jgi:hypothetical protein
MSGPDPRAAWSAMTDAPSEKFQTGAVPVADDAERDRLYAQHAAAYPGFIEYRTLKTRVIPVVLERVH